MVGFKNGEEWGRYALSDNSTVGRVDFGAKLERNWGKKWQNGGGKYALSDNSTVSRVLFLPLIHRKRSPFPPRGRQEKREASSPPSPQGEGKGEG